MPFQPTAKVIYLDQNCWIDIAKVYYNESSEDERRLIQKIFNASKTGQAIFPLEILAVALFSALTMHFRDGTIVKTCVYEVI
jgi:hypothetical protein